MPNINFLSLNEAICYWLGYQIRIGRENLIHEASLRYPIADAITSMGFSIDKIVLEKQHPFFIQRYMDVAITTTNHLSIKDEDLPNKINSIFELKLSKESTSKEFQAEHQRVLNDILRLAYFNLWSKKKAYFIMCGTYGDFKNYFVGQKNEQPTDASTDFVLPEKSKDTSTTLVNEWNSEKSLYKDIFNFRVQKFSNSLSDKKESKTFVFDKTKSDFGFNSFISDYKIKINKEFNNGLKIKTTCLSITPFEAIPSRSHACGIWQIEAIKQL